MPEGANWRCGNKDLLKRAYLNYTWGWKIKPSQNFFSLGSLPIKGLMVFNLLLFLAKYSFKENSQGALARWLAAWNLVRVWQEYDFHDSVFSVSGESWDPLCSQVCVGEGITSLPGTILWTTKPTEWCLVSSKYHSVVSLIL